MEYSKVIVISSSVHCSIRSIYYELNYPHICVKIHNISTSYRATTLEENVVIDSCVFVRLYTHISHSGKLCIYRFQFDLDNESMLCINVIYRDICDILQHYIGINVLLIFSKQNRHLNRK